MKTALSDASSWIKVMFASLSWSSCYLNNTARAEYRYSFLIANGTRVQPQMICNDHEVPGLAKAFSSGRRTCVSPTKTCCKLLIARR